MNKFITIFLIITIASTPTLLVSESIALTRAVVKRNAHTDLSEYLVPTFLARARIALYGLRGCTDALEGEHELHYLINFLAAAHSEEDSNKILIKSYLRTLKDRGCSFDDLDLAGVPPLHGSVIYNDYDLVVFFVENGANINGKIIRSGKKSHGKNALEFANLLQEIEPEVNRNAIIEYLSEKI